MNINIRIDAPDLTNLANGLTALATAIAKKKASSLTEKTNQTSQTPQTSKISPAEAPAAESTESAQLTQTIQTENTVTLEQVRAKLAALSQAGKQAQVKELIAKFGGKKLTDIPTEKYPELLAEAEGL